MKVVLSQVPSYLRMLYVFTCFQSMDMFEVCFKYPYVSSKYDNKSVISMSVFQMFFLWGAGRVRRLGRMAAASAGCLPRPARRSRCGTSLTSRTTSRTGSRWRGPPSSPLWPPSRLKVAAPRVTLKILWKHVKHTWKHTWLKHTWKLTSFISCHTCIHSVIVSCIKSSIIFRPSRPKNIANATHGASERWTRAHDIFWGSSSARGARS